MNCYVPVADGGSPRHVFFDGPRRHAGITNIDFDASQGHLSLTLEHFAFALGDGIDYERTSRTCDVSSSPGGVLIVEPIDR
jgi:hypothetical protein